MKTSKWQQYFNHKFNFLRTTSARVLLNLATIAVVCGLGLYEFVWDENAPSGAGLWLYIAALLATWGLQKISVRFVFDENSSLDEYQERRLIRAYARAYRAAGVAFALIAVGVILAGESSWSLSNQQPWPIARGFVSFSLSNYQVAIALTFLAGFFVLQKYVGWGFKGESLRN